MTTWQVKPGVAPEQALGHWHGDHVELVLAVPGVHRYVQNRCVQSPTGDGPPYAGLGELWFESLDDALVALASPQWGRVIDDAAHFMDMTQVTVAWTVVRTDQSPGRGSSAG